MRERPEDAIDRYFPTGITPARAGKTLLARCFLPFVRDHPRPCGKDVQPQNDDISRLGSPPPVRERLSPHPQSYSHYRITPARAGKTCRATAARPSSQDHPRPCGKDRIGVLPDRDVEGSPPPVRERPCRSRYFSRLIGITPAREGKTCLFPHLHYL